MDETSFRHKFFKTIGVYKIMVVGPLTDYPEKKVRNFGTSALLGQDL